MSSEIPTLEDLERAKALIMKADGTVMDLYLPPVTANVAPASSLQRPFGIASKAKGPPPATADLACATSNILSDNQGARWLLGSLQREELKRRAAS